MLIQDFLSLKSFLFFLLIVALGCHHASNAGLMEESVLIEQALLPKKVNESSGLALVGQKIWTHNDSGSPTELHQVALKNEGLNQSLTIGECTNRDWEELTTDDTYMYVGDFGNNGGNRRDLVIYKVALVDLTASAANIAVQQKIPFRLSDQTHFEHEDYQHNVDCEAMIAWGDDLYLFSKNHLDKRCNVYQISKEDTTGVAMRIDSFDTKGTITAADYSAEGNALALLGYVYNSGNNIPVFVWLFYDFEGADFFGGKQQFIDVKLNAQAEGIVFLNKKELLISTEAEGGGKGRLYTLNVSEWVD